MFEPGLDVISVEPSNLRSDPRDSYWYSFKREMVGGVVGGIFNVVMGHPMDTLRVRI